MFRILLVSAFLVLPTPSTFSQEKPKEPAKLTPVVVLPELPDIVDCVAFSPNGEWLAAGSYKEVRVWRTTDRELVHTLPVNFGYVRSLVFSPDSAHLVAGAYQRIVVWKLSEPATPAVWPGHRGYVTGVDFSRDGLRLASSSDDETVRIWDFPNGNETHQLKGGRYPFMDVAFGPDSNTIATAAGDEALLSRQGETKVWSIAEGMVRFDLPVHERVAVDVTYSKDGKWLATCGWDERVKICESADGKELFMFDEHERPINCVEFSPNAKVVATGCGGRFNGGNEVKLWLPLSGDVLALAEGFSGPVMDLAFSPDGKWLATATQSRQVALFDVAKFTGSDEQNAKAPSTGIKVGIIGLDTSHATAFTKLLNDSKVAEDLANSRVVAAYPKGSPDIESSTSRVPGYTEEVKQDGVEIVDSIEQLLTKVDAVLLETNDGRPHLEQAIPVMKAGKPIFIDKPVAGSLADAIAIYEAAKHYKVPVFSSSSLRYVEGAQAIRNGKLGQVLGCDAYSPCALEKTHPDLFWYGIHGVETLFTVMGTGCESVSRMSTPDLDIAVGSWKGGRLGTFRGIRKGAASYGGTAFGEKGIEQVGTYQGYRPLLVEIVKFYRTGVVPVSPEETLEIYAFMEAAEESKRQGGKPVSIESVMSKAREEAQARLKALGVITE